MIIQVNLYVFLDATKFDSQDSTTNISKYYDNLGIYMQSAYQI